MQLKSQNISQIKSEILKKETNIKGLQSLNSTRIKAETESKKPDPSFKSIKVKKDLFYLHEMKIDMVTLFCTYINHKSFV